jgi:hypothetical protein
MHPTPSAKIPLRDIKDHADLMDAFVQLIDACASNQCGYKDNEITYLKAEIAHFLRIQSAQPGVAFDEGSGPFDKSGAVPDNNVRKHNNNPHL